MEGSAGVSAPAPEDRTGPSAWRPVDRGWVTADVDGIAVFVEKVPGRGEDAPPLHLVDPALGWRLLGAFDGLGGAGAARRVVGGVEYTEAFAAARLARAVVQLAGSRSAHAGDVDVQRWLARALEVFDVRNPAVDGVRVKGRMRRCLPTTLVTLEVRSEGRRNHLRARWTGDSRALVLRPDVGLQALTEDHVRNPDPLVQLVNDGPLANVVSRSDDFVVSCRRVAVDGPCLVLVATDGVFGYVRTPGELEHHLLDTLCVSSDASSWAELLAARISGYTGDDATLALAFVGFDDFDEVRRAFEQRSAAVRRDQFEPMERAVGPEAARAARAHAWERYAPTYEELLAPVG
ncbi:MAG: hypothetical protein KDA94_04250 [Acidimicrobiales bacterium]|nr:hypothetical protein [Acidimicrobiales bacterium]